MDDQKKNDRSAGGGLQVSSQFVEECDILADAVKMRASGIIETLDRGVYTGMEPYLEIESGKEVFYRGDYVTQIPLTKDELLVGRRDVIAGHYPDVDLAMYWKTDKSVSRRHLRFYFNIRGAFFVEDLCNNNVTFLGDYDHAINRECVELHPGDRIIVSRSVVFVFKIR